jgi:hypothetical protein
MTIISSSQQVSLVQGERGRPGTRGTAFSAGKCRVTSARTSLEVHWESGAACGPLEVKAAWGRARALPEARGRLNPGEADIRRAVRITEWRVVLYA